MFSCWLEEALIRGSYPGTPGGFPSGRPRPAGAARVVGAGRGDDGLQGGSGIRDAY